MQQPGRLRLNGLAAAVVALRRRALSPFVVRGRLGLQTVDLPLCRGRCVLLGRALRLLSIEAVGYLLRRFNVAVGGHMRHARVGADDRVGGGRAIGAAALDDRVGHAWFACHCSSFRFRYRALYAAVVCDLEY